MDRLNSGGARALRRLLDGGETQGEPGFLPVGRAAMDGAFFSGLVERRGDGFQGLGGVVLFAGGQHREIVFLQSMEARLDVAILGLLAAAIAHPAFG
jgi:hypothetical protein